MNLLVYLILPAIGSIFIVSYLFYGMYQISAALDQSIKDEHRIRNKKRIWILFIYLIASIMLSVYANSIVNALVTLLMPIAAYIVYQAKKSHLVYYYIMTVALFVLDAAINAFVQYALLTGMVAINSEELIYILYIIFIRFSEFMIIRFVVILVRRRSGQYFTRKQFVVSFILPLFSIFNMYVLAEMMQIYPTSTSYILFCINLLLLVCLNVYFTTLIDTMAKNNRLENEKKLYQQQVKMQQEYYEKESKKYEESRKLVHDMRNHVLAMEKLYEENHAGKALDYAKGLHTILNHLGHKYYTANHLLNIILNDKAGEMDRLKIKSDIKIGDISFDFMSDMDITTIFGNILDNAIYAAKTSGNPYIKFRIVKMNDFISVYMENSCETEPVKRKDGSYISVKSEQSGLGLKNVRYALERYQGDIQFEWKQQVFFTNIMLVGQDISCSKFSPGDPGKT